MTSILLNAKPFAVCPNCTDNCFCNTLKYPVTSFRHSFRFMEVAFWWWWQWWWWWWRWWRRQQSWWWWRWFLISWKLQPAWSTPPKMMKMKIVKKYQVIDHIMMMVVGNFWKPWSCSQLGHNHHRLIDPGGRLQRRQVITTKIINSGWSSWWSRTRKIMMIMKWCWSRFPWCWWQ